MPVRVYLSNMYRDQIPEQELWVSRAEFGKGDLLGISSEQWITITKFVRMRPWPYFVVGERGIALLHAHPGSVGPIADDGSWIPMHCGAAWASRFPELQQVDLDEVERHVRIEFKRLGRLDTAGRRTGRFVRSFHPVTWLVAIAGFILISVSGHWGLQETGLSRGMSIAVSIGVASFAAVVGFVDLDRLITRLFRD